MTEEQQLELGLPEQPTLESITIELRELRQLIQEIRELSDGVLATDRLWNLKQVALYFGCTADNARRVLKNPGSPRPIKVPSSPGHSLTPRYNPDEVRAYAVRQQIKR